MVGVSEGHASATALCQESSQTLGSHALRQRPVWLTLGDMGLIHCACCSACPFGQTTKPTQLFLEPGGTLD